MSLVPVSSPVTMHTPEQPLQAAETVALVVAAAHNIHQITINEVALAALVLIADIGTRDCGISGFEYDQETGIVHTVIRKIEVKKGAISEDDTPAIISQKAQAFCKELVENFNKDHEEKNKDGRVKRKFECKNAHVIINMTSSSRAAAMESGSSAGTNSDVALLNAVRAIASDRITVNVLTQPEEAIISDISLKHIITHSKFCKDNGITVDNTIQVEGGNGSIQSAAILPQQSVELAGKWATAELDAGNSLAAVVTTLKGIIKNEKNLKPAIPGIEYIGVQGSLAVGVALDKGAKLDDADKVLAQALGKDANNVAYVDVANQDSLKNWDQGRKLTPISTMINALKTKINFYQEQVNIASLELLNGERGAELLKAMFKGEEKIDPSNMISCLKAYAFEVKRQDPKLKSRQAKLLEPFFDAWKEMKSSAVPSVLALATLEAIKDKYKTEFQCFVLKDYTLLQKKDGNETTFEAKVSGSHGAAVQYFLKANPLLDRLGKTRIECVAFNTLLANVRLKKQLKTSLASEKRLNTRPAAEQKAE